MIRNSFNPFSRESRQSAIGGSAAVTLAMASCALAIVLVLAVALATAG